jgi:NDP-sugar pyrophosphorylase family protein
VEVGAIILVGGLDENSFEDHRERDGTPRRALGDAPLALQELLGCPIVHHMVDLLRDRSVGKVAVLSEFPMLPLSSAGRAAQAQVKWQHVRPGRIWRAAEGAFVELVQSNGVDEVILLHMGGFLDLDVQDLLAHHFQERCRVTAVVAPDGEPLNAFAISGNRRNDAAYLFRRSLQQTRTPCKNYVFRGYRNRLEDASDLRRLAVAAMLQEIPVQPRGTQVRPGIWVAPGARIHRTARTVAPAFIGEGARILPGAVVTRGGVVEHHSVVAHGAVLESSTLLPYTRVGAGLEIAHSVAAGPRVVHLRHAVELTIADPRLLSSLAPSQAFSGVLSGLGWFTSVLSSLRTLFSNSGGELELEPSTAPLTGRPNRDSVRPVPVHQEAVREDFAASIAVARRYGNE